MTDLANPNAPLAGGGMEREPPELLFSLARFDFLLIRPDEDVGSFEEDDDDDEDDGDEWDSVRIGSEEDAFSAAVFALRRGNPVPDLK